MKSFPLSPDYVGPTQDIRTFPNRRELVPQTCWEVLGNTPEAGQPLITKGVVVLQEPGQYRCVVPCRFSGINLLTEVSPKTNFEPIILSTKFFLVTTPENAGWDLFDTTDPDTQFAGVSFLDMKKTIVFIENRHLCLVSGLSSRRVVTLPRYTPHGNIEVTSTDPREFIICLNYPESPHLSGAYCCNLQKGCITKVP